MAAAGEGEVEAIGSEDVITVLQRWFNSLVNSNSKDPGISIKELPAWVDSFSHVEADKNGDTALILAAKNLRIDLIKHFLNPDNYTLRPGTFNRRIEGNFDEKFNENILRVNKSKENAFTAGLRVAVKLENYDYPIKLLEFCFDQSGINSEQMKLFKRMAKQKNDKGMNILHIIFSAKNTKGELNSRYDFYIQFLEALEKRKIWIHPLTEDATDLHFTPFQYLIRDCPEDKLSRVCTIFKNYCISAAEANYGNNKYTFQWENLLSNRFGFDIVHTRAMNMNLSVKDLFVEKTDEKSSELCFILRKDILEIPSKKITLYQNESLDQLYHNQIVLGGPITGHVDNENDDGNKHDSQRTQEPSKRNAYKYIEWTALHFACNEMSESIKFLVENKFSLSDTTADGKTCAELAKNKDELKEKLGIKRIEIENGPEYYEDECLELILEFVSGVDPVKCALDSCDSLDGQHEHYEQISQRTADAELNERISTKEEKVKFILWCCLKDDDVTTYRNLLHSSYWKDYCRDNHKKTQKDIDKDLLQFFQQQRNANQRSLDKNNRPKMTRRKLQLKDFRLVVNRISDFEKSEDEPLLHYRDNGRIFLYELLNPKGYFAGMSMIELAIRTGRPKMAKALLLTRQMDLIPNAVHTIRVCSKLIETEHLLHFYPIMDVNNELKSVRAFASKVAMNAIDTLFRGCKNSEEKMVFKYLLDIDKENTDHAWLPSFGLKDKDGNQYSTLELARNSQKVEFFATQCFQEMGQRMWNKPNSLLKPRSSNCSSKDHNVLMGLMRYISAPRRKLWLYGFMNMVFIAFLIISLSFPSVNLNWTDIVLIAFALGYIVQECHEFFIRVNTPLEGWKSYVFDIWNIFDQLNIIFLVAALSIKLDLVRRGDVVWGFLDDGTAPSKLQTLGQPFITNIYNYKMVLGTALLFANTKFLKNLRYLQSIGVNLVVMPIIFAKDLFPFAIILFLFISTFGTFFFVTLNLGRFAFRDNEIVRRTDSVLFDIYTRPLMVAFGEFQFEEIANCEGNLGDAQSGCNYEHGVNVYKRFILIVFLLIVNLVMFNMLIAKFSNTVSRYESRSRQIWLSLRDEILIDFAKLTTLPPPFNILGTACILFKAIRSACKQDKDKSNSNNNVKEKKGIPAALVDFYLFQATRFSNQRHALQTQYVETIEDDIKERLYGEDEHNSQILKDSIPIQLNKTRS